MTEERLIRKQGDTERLLKRIRKYRFAGFSAWIWKYGIGRLRYEEAEKLLNEALDGGINFVDSSPCYGIAEEYVGKAIGRRRDEYILATKCGCNVGSHGKFSLGPDHIWTADQLYKNIDRSLELLQTEYIDIWQLHGIMPDYLSGGAQDEVIAAAESIKKSGKVRHIAFSCRNGSPDQPMYPALFGYQACKEMLQWDKFEVIQLIYGALIRTNENIITQKRKEYRNNLQGGSEEIF